MKLIRLILLTNLLLLGCSKNENENVTEAKTYIIRGEVVTIDKNTSRITISHRDIPGLMKAMTMPFKVKNSTLLEDVLVGDSITGKLIMSMSEICLDTLNVV
jgi:protein SCO1/2